MEAPLVTTIIGCYNDESTIEKAIESALSQQYPKGRHHICVIDCGSTDDTTKVAYDKLIKRLPHNKEEDDRVQIYKGMDGDARMCLVRGKSTMNASQCWNLAINLMADTTDLHIYNKMCGNDIIYGSKIAHGVNFIMQDPARIGVVYADYDSYDAKKGVTVREFKPPYNKKRLLKECFIFSESVISKKVFQHLLEADGYIYDENIGGTEDEPFKTSLANYDMWLRTSSKFMITHIPESMTHYNIPKSNEMDSESFVKSLTYLQEKIKGGTIDTQ